MRSRLILSVILSTILSLPALTGAAMESGSYKILFDSVNTGGGLSESASYSLEDTAGEIATGRSESDFYKIAAGYQQMKEVFISLTTTGDITLGAINGVVGGESNGSTTATVLTDGPAGYELYVTASGTPALTATVDSFADYAPAGSDPDFAFSYAASDSVFGFTPEGSDIADSFRDNGAACGTGISDTTDACWQGFATSSILIAEGGANQPAGVETDLNVRAAIGSERLQIAGNYKAYITITAIPK